ncbi:MAG: glycosyltransferase family 4 protein [Phycisphaerae bacterium]
MTICFPFVGDTIGGSHLSTLILIENLDGDRFRPLTVVHEEGPLTEHLRRVGVPYELLPLPAYAGRQTSVGRQMMALLLTVGPLRRFLRRRGVSLVHTQDARMHLTWMLPARLAGAAVVWHQRTRFAPSRLARLMMRFASRVVCISRFVLESLPPAAARRAHVIPNPVAPHDREIDRDVHRAELLRAADAPEDAFIIATIGNLRAVKRPLLFVEAAARMKCDLSRPLLLVVFGEDREGFEPQMRAIAAREGLADRLLFMGFRRPVEPWIAACDVVLAPSVGDAFGRTLVEAMLLGVPVVATDAGGHGEIVRHGETGLLVPPDDADAMAAACVTLLHDPEWAAALTARARKEAQARYSPAAHAAEVEMIYDAALAAV